MLFLGFSFKENCPDVRNTKVIDVVKRLEEYNVQVVIHVPWTDSAQVKYEYGLICPNCESKQHKYDAVLLAVAHFKFKDLDIDSLVKKTMVYILNRCFQTLS